MLGGRRGEDRPDLADQRALGPQAAGLIDEVLHLRGVAVKRVPELVPEEVARNAHFKLDQAAPIATVDEVDGEDRRFLAAMLGGRRGEDRPDLADQRALGPQEEVARNAHFKLDQAAPIATVDELPGYDAIVIGTPTRFGPSATACAICSIWP
jgi:hypothetical protein